MSEELDLSERKSILRRSREEFGNSSGEVCKVRSDGSSAVCRKPPASCGPCQHAMIHLLIPFLAPRWSQYRCCLSHYSRQRRAAALSSVRGSMRRQRLASSTAVGRVASPKRKILRGGCAVQLPARQPSRGGPCGICFVLITHGIHYSADTNGFGSEAGSEEGSQRSDTMDTSLSPYRGSMRKKREYRQPAFQTYLGEPHSHSHFYSRSIPISVPISAQ